MHLHLHQAGPLGPGVGLGVKDEAAGLRAVGGCGAAAAEATDDMNAAVQHGCCECGPGARQVCQGRVVRVQNAVVRQRAGQELASPVHPAKDVHL